jgi:virulence factor Mce-like protein
MIRRRQSAPFANRILIGALTVLVTIVAVFLAYNANNGLPFVPTYDLNVELPDASGLNPSDGVLIGGTRIGYIARITAIKRAGGRYAAVLHLRLNRSTGPLPIDSTDLVRPVSPLGQKYLEITRGHSSQMLRAGATIALSRTRQPVEIDNFFDMFNPPTRAASRSNLNTFGDAFAGRGTDLNTALSQLQPLVGHLLSVMRNLNDPRTRWAQLFPGLEQAAHEVVGVATQQAQLFAGLDETFTPLSQSTAALQAAIVGGPPALRTATHELPAQAQFINDTTKLFHRFRPAFASLGAASTQLAPAIAVGIPALHRAPQLNGRLVTTVSNLERFAEDSRTLPGLSLLTETASLIEPTIAFATPAQTRCNYLALFFRNLEGALSESDVVGSMLRVVALPLPQLPNSEAGPSSAPANGPPVPAGTPLTVKTLEDDSFLHSNPYPNTAAPGQSAECEAGNETYLSGRLLIGNEPGTQGLKTETTKRLLR